VIILRYLLDEDPRRQIGGNGDARRSDPDDHASLAADDAEHNSLADADIAKTPGRLIAEREEADLDGRTLRRRCERDGGSARTSPGACHGGSTSRVAFVRVDEGRC
jgi:hypothetical protein